MISTSIRDQIENKTLKLYVGARKIRPDGFCTLDLDPRMEPDIVADVCKMTEIENGCCEEVIANAVLEHIDWPDGFLAIAELVRIIKVGGILKISVPDIATYCQLLLNNDSSKFHVMGIMFGIGGRANKFEQHRYGYTAAMLCEILQLLGCGEFNWMFPLAIGDSSGGWTPRWKEQSVAECLNFTCRKIGEPPVSPQDIYKVLLEDPFADLLGIASSQKIDQGVIPGEAFSPLLYQKIHFELIKAGQRIKYLEEQLNKKANTQ